MAQGVHGRDDAARRGFLWGEVVRTRVVVRRLKGGPLGPAGRDELLRARRGLLGALEGYAGELSSHGHPIPYQLRDEIRLCRLTLRSS